MPWGPSVRAHLVDGFLLIGSEPNAEVHCVSIEHIVFKVKLDAVHVDSVYLVLPTMFCG